MAETLHALGEILVQALPTFFLVILLYLYLNAMFFKPMAKLMAERRAATQGAREAAKAALDRAAEKANAYEESMRAARADLYKEQEEQRRKWREQQAEEVRQARQRTEQMVANAKKELAEQTQQAKQSLAGNAGSLANEIVDMILHRRAA